MFHFDGALKKSKNLSDFCGITAETTAEKIGPFLIGR